MKAPLFYEVEVTVGAIKAFAEAVEPLGMILLCDIIVSGVLEETQAFFRCLPIDDASENIDDVLAG